MADCLAGEVVVGGGYHLPAGTSAAALQNYASGAGQWTVLARSSQGSPFTITAYALCIPTP